MIYSNRPCSPDGHCSGVNTACPSWRHMTVFYVRAKLHFSPTRLPIEPGATLKRAHTFSPKTQMRFDHFGHNYELRDRALPDAKDVCSQLVLVSGLAHGRLGWRKLSQLQADRLPLNSVCRLCEGATPDQRRNARVNALDSEYPSDAAISVNGSRVLSSSWQAASKRISSRMC
jgi:hypothetical protein